MTRLTTRTNPIICMSSNYHSSSIIIITSCTRRSYYNTTNRSKFKYIIFRPSWRWRSNSIPTFILILRSSRSIYFNYSWIWGYFSYCNSLQSKNRIIWLTRHNLCNTRYCSTRIYCMSSPHIYRWNRRRYTCILYSSNYNYCCTHWN